MSFERDWNHRLLFHLPLPLRQGPLPWRYPQHRRWHNQDHHLRLKRPPWSAATTVQRRRHLPTSWRYKRHRTTQAHQKSLVWNVGAMVVVNVWNVGAMVVVYVWDVVVNVWDVVVNNWSVVSCPFGSSVLRIETVVACPFGSSDSTKPKASKSHISL